MVHKLRLKLEAAAAILDPPHDSGPRLEANRLHLGISSPP